MTRTPLPALASALLLTAATLGQALPDKIFGLKSCGSSAPICGNVPSAVPVHLYSFLPDGSAFVDVGPVTLGGAAIDVDGLAVSPVHGLLAFRLEQGIHGQYESSYLVALDPTNGLAYARGPALDREIRGACFDGMDQLWVIDADDDELLRVDPLTGLEVGPPVAMRHNGRPFSLHDISDLAIAVDGTFHVTSRNDIFTVDAATGDLTLVLTDTGHGNAGAAFWTAAGSRTLITFDVNYIDDLLRYDLTTPGMSPTLLLGNVLPLFNAGRGDLAALRSDVLLARCTFRNGSGLNPTDYSCLTRPAVGTSWQTSIVTSPLTVGTFVALAFSPDPGLPFLGGEILIGVVPTPSLLVGNGSHTLTIPNAASLIGNFVPTQGFRVDGVGPTTRLVLLNAQDLVIGL